MELHIARIVCRKHLIRLLLFLIISPVLAQETAPPYAADIRKFQVSDSINPPPQHAILFAGSSSFTMWTDVQDYFPGYTIINRGFGGSTLQDWIRYAEENGGW